MKTIHRATTGVAERKTKQNKTQMLPPPSCLGVSFHFKGKGSSQKQKKAKINHCLLYKHTSSVSISWAAAAEFMNPSKASVIWARRKTARPGESAGGGGGGGGRKQANKQDDQGTKKYINPKGFTGPPRGAARRVTEERGDVDQARARGDGGVRTSDGAGVRRARPRAVHKKGGRTTRVWGRQRHSRGQHIQTNRQTDQQQR